MTKTSKFSSIILIFSIILFVSCEKNEVTSVSMSSSSKILNIGDIDSLYAKTAYKGDIVPSITWTSSDNSVVKVKDGEIEAIKKGTAVITAKAGDKTAICNITVSDEFSPKMTQGELWYYGDAYETNISNNFVVYLATSGIKMEDFSGDGEIIYLEFNTSLSATNNLPIGTYNMTTMDFEKFNPFTIVPGFEYDGYKYGTWYFGRMANDVVEGTTIVSFNNNKYTIQYDLVDYYGNSITGTFVGNLQLYDGSETVQTVKKKLRTVFKK